MRIRTRILQLEALALLLLSPQAWACTAPLWNLQTTTLQLGQVPIGTAIPITINGTATGYNGSNGGPVTVSPSASGPLTFSGFSTNLIPGNMLPFTFSGSLTPTQPGLQTGSLSFQPYCGTFTTSPSMVQITYTGIATTSSVPPPSALFPYVGLFGEPVSTTTGELFGYDETADLSVRGPFPLTFQRYYGSLLGVNKVASALGTNWMSNYDVSLAVTASTATVTLFRGKTVTFKQSAGAWQLSSTEQRPFQLIAAGSGYRFLDPRSGVIYSFNSSGALTALQDRNGNTLTITPGPGGPTQVADGLGRTLTFTYTGANLTKVQDQAGRSVTFAYTSGNLTSWTNAAGKTTTFAYTAAGTLSGLMTTSTRPAGNQPLSQTYDSQGRVATQSHGVGATMTFTYNSSGNGATVATPGGPTLTDVNDGNNNLTSTSDSTNLSSKFTYDSSNRILTSTNRAGATESFTYDSASGLPSSHTDQAGFKTTYKYAASTANGFTYYDLASVGYPDGTSVTYTRDANGNVLAHTDQAGNKTQFTYNAAGQILTTTSPTGSVTTQTYGSDGMLASSQRSSGELTSYTYDAAKRRILVTNPDGTTRATTYDALDAVTSVTDERGNISGATFDANENLRTAYDALNAVSSFSYDADDRTTTSVDARGATTTRAWDAAGRLQSVTDPTAVSTSYTYDSLNRPTQILDTALRGLTLSWDQEARLSSATDALSRTTTFTREQRGLVTATKTPKGETSSFSYDSMGRRSSTTDPLGRGTTFTYEARGRLASVAMPGGVSSKYTYDALGHLTAKTDPLGNAWNSAYDSQGRLAAVTDPLGQSTSLKRDSRRHVSSVTFPQNLGSAQNTFDAHGNRTAVNYSDGTALTYTYDANNRLTSANGITLAYDANGRISNSNGLLIGRDAAGRIASVTYAPGKVAHYTYESRGLLSQVTDWVGGTTSFTYDAAHQLTSRTLANGVTETYTYDADGRVASIQAAQGSTTISSIALTRDADGRVTSAVRSAPNVPNVPTGYFGDAFDAASQAWGSGYDPLGRVTQDGLTGRTYTWDLASRLTSYSGSNGTASFTYDANGQRISSTTGGVTQNYVLNYALPMSSVATVKTGGSDLRYYIWLPNGTLLESVEASGGARHFYHFDESGTTNFLTGDSGAVTDSYASTPYGETMIQTGTTPNPFTFQGAFGVMQEGSTGLYYMRARYYDSASARFIARDPVNQTDPRAIPPYQFAYSNPVERADPSGMNPGDEAAVALFFVDVMFGDNAVPQFLPFTWQPSVQSTSFSSLDSFNSTLDLGTSLSNTDLNSIDWGAGQPSTFSWSSSSPASGPSFGDLNAFDPGLNDIISDVELALDAAFDKAMDPTLAAPAPAAAPQTSPATDLGLPDLSSTSDGNTSPVSPFPNIPFGPSCVGGVRLQPYGSGPSPSADPVITPSLFGMGLNRFRL